MSELKDTEIGLIPESWAVSTIGEIGDVTKLAGYEYTKHITYVEDGEIIALRALNVRDGVLDLTDLKRIYKTVSDELPRSKLYTNDILFTYVGANIGQFALVPENEKFHLAPNICRIRCKEEYNPYFLYSYFRTYQFKKHLEGFVNGSSQGTLPMGNIRLLQIPKPPLHEQNNIVSIFSLLDDKITLLREQNQTLEELAQTLFKRWFVEFEFPNENGQPYKSSGGKMVESELGEIPEGWRVGEVSDFVNHSTKSVSPSKEPNKIFSHYSIPAFDSGRYPTKDTGESILSNKYEVLENSILVSKLNPSTSRIWTVFEPRENGICSTEIQVFVPNTNAYAFSFGLFHYSGIKREMAQRASGTSSSHQRVRPGDILNIEFVVPKEETLKRFEDSVLGLLKKIEDNQEEIQSLTQLRDTLLPKLMSGELRVKE